ncbi:MAG: HAD-IC family P-type ATPase [Actinomycetota bacterium]
MSDETVRGLTAAEVRERIADGKVNIVESRASRSVAHILRSNLLTRFNAIISVMLVIVLVFGHLPDALFGLVMVTNAVIGIVQELRAKWTLDRLRVLVAPSIEVVRDGQAGEIPVDDIVLDDIIKLSSGDQVPADGVVVGAASFQVDESLLTGEADPVHKETGAPVLSGSFVVAGSATARIVAVGEDAYAQRLAAEAKEFTLARSELRDGIDRILGIVTWLLIPIGALLLWSQLTTDRSIAEALVSTVAGVVGMVPQGLVLLVSMALAVAVIRLGKRRALVQELPAVETLARVDVVCADKTGTLTTGSIRHRGTTTLGACDPAVFTEAIAAIAAADPNPNPTMQGIADAFPGNPGWRVERFVPFSSARKFSAVQFAGGRSWVMGAPEIVIGDGTPAVIERLAAAAEAGDRVLLVSVADAPLPAMESEFPPGLEPCGFLTFAEQIRDDAAETIGYFVDQRVTPKVISGDSAATVATIAGAVGVPNAGRSIDARELPDPDTPDFDRCVEDNAVFGRVTPDQKRHMVTALQHGGHTVAMTGDGVNDVLALKRADIGIAMGTGAPATRAVAQIVLLDNNFSVLPHVVAEGRRVIANMERVASLFVTKTVYAAILAVAIGFAGWAFPLLPRHLTLIGSLTVGIPAFFLSFEATEEPVRPGAYRRVMRFAIPAGIVAAVAAYGVYSAARVFDSDLTIARSATTTAMVLVGMWVLVELASPLSRNRTLLVAALLVGFGLTLALPAGRAFFDLVLLPPAIGAVVLVVSALAAGALHALLWMLDHHGGSWVPWVPGENGEG